MEAILILFGLGILLAPFVLSIVALARSSGASRVERQLSDLREEIGRLRSQVLELKDSQGGAPAREPSGFTHELTPPDADLGRPVTLPPVASEPVPDLAPIRTAEQAAYRVADPNPRPKLTPLPESETTPVPSVEQPKPAAALPGSESGATKPAAEPTPARKESGPSGFEEQPTIETVPYVAPAAAAARPPKKPWNLEQALGGQGFLWVGVSAVTVGVALFLYYAAQQMGAAGKVAIGFGGGAALLGVGFFAERREKYRVFGRPLIAGGCAIIYFVTFAMHFIPAARLIDSEVAAVLLLFLAGGLGVGLSLRYRHEWTTTFSFLLIFLTLGVAAAKTDATFNLVSTAIVAAGLAFLVWRLAWDRLLALGTTATWITLSLWLLPNTIDLPAMNPVDGGKLFSLVAPIAGTWAAFQLAMLLRRREHEIKETWHVFGYVANMLGGFGLVIHLVHTLTPGAAWAVAASFGVLYVACAWLFQRRGRRILYLMSGTIGLVAFAMVSPLRLGMDSYWVPFVRLLGIELVIFAGILLKERYFRVLGYLAFLFTVLEVLLLKNDPVLVTLLGLSFHHRILLLVGTTLVGYLNVFLMRRIWRTTLTPGEIPSIFYFFSAAATSTLLFLVWMEVKDVWVAPTLAGVALIAAVAANRLALKDFVLEAGVFAAAALIAIVGYDLDATPTTSGIPLRPIALGLVIAALVVAYSLYRFRLLATPEPTFTEYSKPAAVFMSVVAGIVILLLVTQDVPPTWVAPTFAALVVGCFWLGLRRGLAELLYEGMAFTLTTVCCIAYFSWPLTHHVLGLPARPVSAGLAVALFYVAQQLLERFLGRKPDGVSLAVIMGGWPTFAMVTSGYLTLATVLVGWITKAEALVWDKNLLVALVLGVVGVVYLEVARTKGARRWLLHGHAVLLVATVHLFLVNFVQDGNLGPLSLRLVTVAPFFLFLLYVYLTFDDTTAGMELTPKQRDWGYFYLYDMVAVAAVLMMYELMRAWVIVGWTVLGVAILLRWQKTQNPHWRLSALILGIAALGRSLAVNLYYRDETTSVRWNLWTIPLTCLGLLAGYLIIRRTELKAASAGDAGGRDVMQAARRPRMAWFVALVVLLTSFIWVEAEGTLLTVWLSAEGLAIVGLGFFAKERLSRLTGLLMLSFCILKLFIYDLRDLTGLARIGSFIVLGLVLIAVSFAYTRFKERLQEIL